MVFDNDDEKPYDFIWFLRINLVSSYSMSKKNENKKKKKKEQVLRIKKGLYSKYPLF